MNYEKLYNKIEFDVMKIFSHVVSETESCEENVDSHKLLGLEEILLEDFIRTISYFIILNYDNYLNNDINSFIKFSKYSDIEEVLVENNLYIRKIYCFSEELLTNYIEIYKKELKV